MAARRAESDIEVPDSDAPQARIETTSEAAKTGRRAVKLLIITSTLAAIVVAGGMAWLLMSLRDRAIKTSTRELQTTALVLAEQTQAAIQALELIQSNVLDRIRTLGVTTSDGYEAAMSDKETHLLLQQKIESLPYIEAVNLINADGKLFNYSRQWPVRELSIADRQFFKTLKENPKISSVVSEPLYNRTTGTLTVYLARKVVGPDGQFIGAILGAMPLDYFEGLYRAVASDSDQAIALFRADGVLLARHPAVEAMVGKLFLNSTVVQSQLRATSSYSARQSGVIDGRERLIALRKLQRFPLIVTVSTPVDEVFATWLSETHLLIGLGILLIVVIGGACTAAVHRVREQSRMLDVTLNNIPFGIIMFDPEKRLKVVNRRYSEMYGLGAEAVQAGRTLRFVLEQRVRTRNFSGDLSAYLEELDLIIKSGRVYTQTIETPDGRSIAVTTRPMSDGSFVSIHDDITERRRIEDRIAYMAHHDALTDLPNRVAFGEHLTSALERARRTSGAVALLTVDLDRFKEINDLFGHQTGDVVLREVAARLNSVKEGAFLARVGGDELVLVSEGLQPELSIELASRLHAAASADLEVDGQTIKPELSIGVAIHPTDATDIAALLANADAALYRAKAEGRSRTKFFEPSMDKQLRDQRALVNDLRAAIKANELFLEYQPQATIDGHIIGFEALVRWQHRSRGLIAPSVFIPLAEANGLIPSIGEWVLREACRVASGWKRSLQIAVNLSPMQFRDGDLVDVVHRVLLETGLAASRLELEITEGVLVEDFSRAVSTLRRLKNLGVRIAMDDFGTGYSSLSYLQSFPFEKIKIDRSFIRDVETNAQSAAIVRLIISLARGLVVPVMAEGVETPGQQDFLRKEGCDEIQGYLIGRPMRIANYHASTGLEAAA